MENKNKIVTIVSIVGGALSLLVSFFVVDDRWGNDELSLQLESAKNEIISEMRSGIGMNRSALITALQRSADDLEYKISQLEKKGEDVPRIDIERLKGTQRQIEDLKDETDNPTE